ncbi:MAG: type II secretion system protein [Lachnospiraceae bacterium]
MKEKMEVRMKEKMNNKGFSLVELIIVIAIMAVLIAVLAPQFLRYVEKSRYQKDITAVAELENAVEIAMANELYANAMSSYLGTTTPYVVAITKATGAFTAPALPALPGGSVTLQQELERTIGGSTLSFTSNSIANSAAELQINVVTNATTGALQVTVVNGVTAP